MENTELCWSQEIVNYSKESPGSDVFRKTFTPIPYQNKKLHDKLSKLHNKVNVA